MILQYHILQCQQLNYFFQQHLGMATTVLLGLSKYHG